MTRRSARPVPAASARPSWNPAARTLAVAQYGNNAADTAPLSIFAAALRGPVAGHETSVRAFFGDGSRRIPAEVAGDRLSGALAGGSAPGTPGHTLFAFRAPLTLAPGASMTLRYIYGMAHPGQIAALVSAVPRAAAPLAASRAGLGRVAAQGRLRRRAGGGSRASSRGMPTCCARPRCTRRCAAPTPITQGGYYQYGTGLNLGYRELAALPAADGVRGPRARARDPALHGRPAAADRRAASVRHGPAVQPRRPRHLRRPRLLAAPGGGGVRARDARHRRSSTSSSRSTTRQAPATVWEHIKLAYQHQETLLGPHGGYLAGTNGDWSDFSATYPADDRVDARRRRRLAYAYPRLAELADRLGDDAFAAELRTARRESSPGGARPVDRAGLVRARLRRATARSAWGRSSGSHSPGRSSPASPRRPRRPRSCRTSAASWTGSVRRGGPRSVADRDSSLSPASNDPGGHRARRPRPAAWATTTPTTWAASGSTSTGGSPGRSASSTASCPSAGSYAWSEYTRNTLANHAHAFPDHWAGTISIDDACYGYYSSTRSSAATASSSSTTARSPSSPRGW